MNKLTTNHYLMKNNNRIHEKKYILIFLTTIIINFFFYSRQGSAINFSSQHQCVSKEYVSSLIKSKKKLDSCRVIINSDYAESNYDNNIIFTGNVNIKQGNSYLRANKIQLYQKTLRGSDDPIYIIDALGNVCYKNNYIILNGQRGLINLNNKNVDIWKGSYQLINYQGYGTSDIIKQREKSRYIILKNGSFTSCTLNSDTWSIIGKKIVHDQKEKTAKIWNAYFMLSNTPLFYIPYFQFSMNKNKLHSGFLIPKIRYTTSNYFEFCLPYYWNISSNLDFFVKPRYIHKQRNIMWENELHYFAYKGTGLIKSNYLPSYEIYKDKYLIKNNRPRWLFYWKHNGILNKEWNFNINYTKVSDLTYFNDFDSEYKSNNDSYNSQIFDLIYSTQNLDATISIKKFQPLNQNLNSSYFSKPQLDINWYFNDLSPLNFKIYGQVGHFTNLNSNMPKSIRLHLEPSIDLTLFNNWARLNTETKLMVTHYRQNNLEYYNSHYNSNLENTVNRVLPQLKIDGKIALERNLNFLNTYTQTLEPHIQYLYIPYRDQKKIHNYDSMLLQSNYTNLFSGRIYSGIDRIISVNRIIIGITSQIFNKKTDKCFNFSIGESYDLNNFRSSHINNIYWKKKKISLSPLALASETYWNIDNHWGFRGSMYYDRNLHSIQIGNGTIEYRHNKNKLIQFNYRYISPEYIQTMLSNCKNTNKDYKKEISQIGTTVVWPILNRWFISGTYYFNNRKNTLIDQTLKLEYNSPCYSIYFGYERNLNNLKTNHHQKKYNNAIILNIELRGLTPNFNSNTQKILHSNMIPYRSIF